MKFVISMCYNLLWLQNLLNPFSQRLNSVSTRKLADFNFNPIHVQDSLSHPLNADWLIGISEETAVCKEWTKIPSQGRVKGGVELLLVAL